MNKILKCILVSFCLFSLSAWADSGVLKQAYEAHQSDIQVQGFGTVIRILPDDTKGSRHQKFILRLDNHQTILIAHNIDLAPRVTNLKVGDTVRFNGEYEWNSKGGVIHWTHRDPHHHHAHGWLKHNGRVFS
ncbi:DUF3465 domain-containing protein [Photobacterium sanguinicancri]|uniref:DUF3465 domain-containing protein n=1 Tax=Photobacterium sanguinicancri TaxID=875932 RepID=UPI0021C4B705|nr:DUF3465 domain-containing protein [Photobacterium sanguinicancri]